MWSGCQGGAQIRAEEFAGGGDQQRAPGPRVRVAAAAPHLRLLLALHRRLPPRSSSVPPGSSQPGTRLANLLPLMADSPSHTTLPRQDEIGRMRCCLSDDADGRIAVLAQASSTSC